MTFLNYQRDTIQAASNFAQRNQLPHRLQDQMLAHLCLKYRTDSEGLQQQETLDSLPKAIRSSISHHLFYSLIDKVYLFHGVSNDLLFQLVNANFLSLLRIHTNIYFNLQFVLRALFCLTIKGIRDES